MEKTRWEEKNNSWRNFVSRIDVHRLLLVENIVLMKECKETKFYSQNSLWASQVLLLIKTEEYYFKPLLYSSPVCLSTELKMISNCVLFSLTSIHHENKYIWWLGRKAFLGNNTWCWNFCWCLHQMFHSFWRNAFSFIFLCFYRKENACVSSLNPLQVRNFSRKLHFL